MTRTVLAIGAHIGDMDLTAGPTLAKLVLEGANATIVALTPGERGHPRLSPAECALLVALPRSPERLLPDRHPEAARAARDAPRVRSL